MTQIPSVKTVLIIEDQDGFRQIYGDRLALGGYNILEAVNGIEGLEMMRLHHVDLVLLDLLMPEMTGEEVLKQIRADQTLKDIPVIVFSVFDQRERVEKLRELGANGHLVKGRSTPNDVLIEVNKTLSL